MQKNDDAPCFKRSQMVSIRNSAADIMQALSGMSRKEALATLQMARYMVELQHRPVHDPDSVRWG